MHRALFTYTKYLTQRRITPDPPILLVGSGDDDVEGAGVLQTFYPDLGSECVVHQVAAEQPTVDLFAKGNGAVD